MININGSIAGDTAIHAETTQIHAESTLVALSLYSRTGVSPNLAARVDVTPTATAWELGAAAALVATGGIATAFQITGVNVEAMGTTSGDCEIILYEGTAASSAVAAVRFMGSTSIGAAVGGVSGLHIPVTTPQIAANKSVYAKCAALTTTVPVPAISISYKTKK